MLRGWIVAFGKVLLHLKHTGEEVCLRVLDDFTRDAGVNLQTLLLGLVARELINKFAELGGRFGDVAAFVVAFEAASDFVQEATGDGDIGVANLLVKFVGGVELNFAFEALRLRSGGGSGF